jgi:3-oxoacyl-[acyl-carrier protein] reductase
MLAELGADVVLNARDPAKLAEAVRGVAATGVGRVAGVPGDAASAETIGELMSAAEQWGGASIAVANAGGGTDTRVVTEECAAQLWRQNVWSAQSLIDAVHPTMVRQGWGRIVTVSSLAARSHSPTSVAAYAAAKAGVIAVTRSAALDLAAHGVTVNSVAPGVTATDRIAERLGRMSEEQVMAIRSQIPVGRWAEASEIASAIVFLCSPGSGFITGHTLDVNGGAWMN